MSFEIDAQMVLALEKKNIKLKVKKANQNNYVKKNVKFSCLSSFQSPFIPSFLGSRVTTVKAREGPVFGSRGGGHEGVTRAVTGGKLYFSEKYGRFWFPFKHQRKVVQSSFLHLKRCIRPQFMGRKRGEHSGPEGPTSPFFAMKLRPIHLLQNESAYQAKFQDALGPRNAHRTHSRWYSKYFMSCTQVINILNLFFLKKSLKKVFSKKFLKNFFFQKFLKKFFPKIFKKTFSKKF